MSVPTLLANLDDVIDEYNYKLENVSDNIKDFKTSIDKIGMDSCIMGTFANTIVSPTIAPHQNYIEKNLLESAWKYIAKECNFDVIASQSDKKAFELSMSNPAPFTKDNIIATFGDYVANPRFHVLKGLAEVFCRLDPFYKSHSNMKIGVNKLPKRIIISRSYSYSSFNTNDIRSLLNAIAIVEGRPTVEYGTLREIEDRSRLSSYEYNGFTFKQFANGNTHVHFSENKLTLVNRALAEFYGDVLPDTPDEVTKKKTSTEVSKDLQFYPTPKAVIHRILNQLDFRDGDKVLEPSCGDGAIMDELRFMECNVDITGIEYDKKRASIASSKGHFVLDDNFLQLPIVEKYDKVVMNPPFYGKHYLKHIEHAMKFIKKGGVLACILPATAWYNHKLLPTGGIWYDLPVASFKESGTNIPTGFYILRI